MPATPGSPAEPETSRRTRTPRSRLPPTAFEVAVVTVRGTGQRVNVGLHGGINVEIVALGLSTAAESCRYPGGPRTGAARARSALHRRAPSPGGVRLDDRAPIWAVLATPLVPFGIGHG